MSIQPYFPEALLEDEQFLEWIQTTSWRERAPGRPHKTPPQRKKAAKQAKEPEKPVEPRGAKKLKFMDDSGTLLTYGIYRSRDFLGDFCWFAQNGSLGYGRPDPPANADECCLRISDKNEDEEDKRRLGSREYGELVLGVLREVIDRGLMTEKYTRDLSDFFYCNTAFFLPTFSVLVPAEWVPERGAGKSFYEDRLYKEPLDIGGKKYRVCNQWAPLRIRRLKAWLYYIVAGSKNHRDDNPFAEGGKYELDDSIEEKEEYPRVYPAYNLMYHPVEDTREYKAVMPEVRRLIDEKIVAEWRENYELYNGEAFPFFPLYDGEKSYILRVKFGIEWNEPSGFNFGVYF